MNEKVKEMLKTYGMCGLALVMFMTISAGFQAGGAYIVSGLVSGGIIGGCIYQLYKSFNK